MDTNVLQMSQPQNFGGGERTFAIQKLLQYHQNLAGGKFSN